MDERVVDPISAAADVLGDRWTLLILRDIVFADRRNFRTLLLGSPEGIASNILADRLVKLVEGGLLTRGQGRRGQRATYSLTEAGIQTVPLLEQLARWASTWRAEHLVDGDTPFPDTANTEELMNDLRQRHHPADS